MRAVVKKIAVIGMYFASIIFLIGTSAFSSEIVSNGDRASVLPALLDDPFLLPQTNFSFGNVSYAVQFSKSSGTSAGEISDSGLNVYGFDLEVSNTRFMNIGAYMRFESLGEFSKDIGGQFSALLGGFTRFYYVPPFFNTKSFKANMFLRLEVGAGPVFFGMVNGVLLQPGVHVGSEAYFNKWIGVSLSYGLVYEVGRDTLLGNTTIWNQGSAFFVALKTTFL